MVSFRKGCDTPFWHAQPSVENCSSSQSKTLRFSGARFRNFAVISRIVPGRETQQCFQHGERRRTMGECTQRFAIISKVVQSIRSARPSIVKCSAEAR